MLIVAGTISIDPSDLESLRGALGPMVEATLEETGCHQYAFSESLTNPGTVHIFEIWQSPEELTAHFETRHMAEFRKTLDGLTILGRELHQYEVANVAKM